MKDIIEFLINLAFIIGLVFGSGKSIVWLHDLIRKETIKTISQGLSSTEKISKSLTEKN